MEGRAEGESEEGRMGRTKGGMRQRGRRSGREVEMRLEWELGEVDDEGRKRRKRERK